MRNVCVPCGIEMRPKKNEVYAVLMDSKDVYDVVRSADLWHCPCCKRETITGFGLKNIAIGHEDCKALLDNVKSELIYRFYREKQDDEDTN